MQGGKYDNKITDFLQDSEKVIVGYVSNLCQHDRGFTFSPD